jgi:hypothetical protein
MTLLKNFDNCCNKTSSHSESALKTRIWNPHGSLRASTGQLIKRHSTSRKSSTAEQLPGSGFCQARILA